MIHLQLWGLPITATNISEVIDFVKRKPEHKAILVSFINPHAFYLASKNEQYSNLLKEYDIILPDGVAVKKALAKVHKVPCERISFDSTSLALPIFEWAEKEQKSIILVGGEPGITAQAAEQIKKSYPSLSIISTLDGYTPKDELTKEISSQSPDIVICGMGAPHQEELLLLLKTSGWKGVGFTCGGYFDQLSSGMQYYPQWIDRLNIRFLYRIYKEPRRLWRRYFIEYRVFIKLYINSLLKG